MVKRALLVGCNYPGMPCELKGSANDVERMRKLLVKRFKFDNEEILQLVDTDPEGRQPTGANIRQCLVSFLKTLLSCILRLFAMAVDADRGAFCKVRPK